MKNRQVLVTGAGGFVGRALALGFAGLGWRVIGLDRAFDERWESDGMRRSTVELAEGVPSDIPDVDLIVHAAWVTTDPATLGVTTEEYIALNTRPLLTMLEHASRTSPAAFVFLSSSGVFAATDETEGLKDTCSPTGTSPYAVAKQAGEALVLSALDSQTEVHVVRLGYLFGPGEVARPSRVGVSLVAGWLAAVRQGEALAVRSDDPLREWTFTSDLAVALEQVVDGPSAGHPVHLGSTHVSRDSAFAALIASELPGTEPVTVPAEGPVKPPMIPSDIPALRDFAWTDPTTGLRALLAAEVVA
jgi:nucleoside-diphosphate-sugar epimerase